MRRLLIVVLVAAAAYGGYWFVGARAAENGARDGLTQLAEQGWQVGYEALSTRGFPSRFDTTVTDLDLTTPDGQVRYQAPFLQAFALSYQPTQVIVAFPTRQDITLGGQVVTLASEGLRVSAAARANAALTFETATLEAQLLALSSDTGGVRTGPVLAAMRAGADLTYDLYGKVDKITLPDDLWQQMFPNGALPLSIAAVTLNGQITLDRTLDRFALDPEAGDPPRVMAVKLSETRLDWGDLTIAASGDLRADASGFAEGEVTIRARGLDDLLRGLSNIGAIAPGMEQSLQSMATGLADGQGDVTLTLTMSGGLTRMGFLPVGAAPRLY